MVTVPVGNTLNLFSFILMETLMINKIRQLYGMMVDNNLPHWIGSEAVAENMQGCREAVESWTQQLAEQE